MTLQQFVTFPKQLLLESLSTEVLCNVQRCEQLGRLQYTYTHSLCDYITVGSVQVYSHDLAKHNIEVMEMQEDEYDSGVGQPNSAHRAYVQNGAQSIFSRSGREDKCSKTLG